jgi:hypothetical protein
MKLKKFFLMFVLLSRSAQADIYSPEVHKVFTKECNIALSSTLIGYLEKDFPWSVLIAQAKAGCENAWQSEQKLNRINGTDRPGSRVRKTPGYLGCIDGLYMGAKDSSVRSAMRVRGEVPGAIEEELRNKMCFDLLEKQI